MNDTDKINIVIAPFVCTVPRGGLRSVACYPDAKTFFYKGRKYGYSESARTLIAPIKGTLSEAREAQREILEHRKVEII